MFCTPDGVAQSVGSADVPVLEDGVGVVEVLVGGVVAVGGTLGAEVVGADGAGVLGGGAVVAGGVRTGGAVEHGQGSDSQ
jgi:hypothetical protein